MSDKTADTRTNKDSLAPTCGLVMPISTVDGCSVEHWLEVKAILTEAVSSIDAPRFQVKLVSDADDIGIIQKRIVQNVYSSEILICDVSGKNPNVMFELGMRLAFDRATVIVKDDKTDYSFDTGMIEHIPYPRDLRFSKIVAFKATLAEKVLATYRASQDPGYSTFLKNFGTFQTASLTESVVPTDRMVLEMLGEIQAELSRMRRSQSRELRSRPVDPSSDNVSALVQAVSEYCRKNRTWDAAALISNDAFVSEMERAVDAPHRFSSATDFRNTLGSVLTVIQPALMGTQSPKSQTGDAAG